MPAKLKLPGQQELVLSNRLPSFQSEDSVLSFITYHQELLVFIDNQLVYTLDSSRDPLKKTPGNVLNRISLDASQQGKTIRIHFRSVYPDLLGTISPFFIGSWFDMVKKIIKDSAIAFLTCISILIIGLANLLRSVVFRSEFGINSRLLYLGLFAILFAIVSVGNTSLILLSFSNLFSLSYFIYFGYLLLPFPGLMYVSDIFAGRKSKLIRSACDLSLAVIVISLFLLISGIADLRESRALVHLTYIFGVSTVAIEIFRKKSNPKFRGRYSRPVYFLSFLFLIVAILLDIARYYLFKNVDATFLFRIVLAVCLIILSIETEKENQSMIVSGMDADEVRKVVYTDGLTGIWNRTAFTENLAGIPASDFLHYRLVMMDLNSLKSVNDKFGHSAGDIYIMNSAHLIQDSFAQHGVTYRLSGDEFCSLLKNCSEREFGEAAKEIEAGLDRLSKNSPFKYSIALGDAVFDPLQDNDLMRTLARADLVMYQHKREMKATSRDGERSLTDLRRMKTGN